MLKMYFEKKTVSIGKVFKGIFILNNSFWSVILTDEQL